MLMTSAGLKKILERSSWYQTGRKEEDDVDRDKPTNTRPYNRARGVLNKMNNVSNKETVKKSKVAAVIFIPRPPGGALMTRPSFFFLSF